MNRGPDEPEPSVDDRDSGRTVTVVVISMPGEDSSGIISASSLAKGTGQRAAYRQGLQNANMPKPTHGREKLRSQVEADAKTTQPVSSVMPVGS